MQHQDQLLDVRGAAHRLGLSPFTIRRWIQRGQIPHVRLGRRRLFDPGALDLFVRSHMVKPRNQSRQ